MGRQMFDQTVFRQRAPQTGTDSHGRPIRDWENAAEQEYEDVSMQPTGSTESSSQPGQRTINRWRLQTRAGVDMDVVTTDRIRWGDRVLEVVAEVARWPHPIKRGHVHHVEVDLQLVKG
jgi:hypothetical protein